MKNWRTAAVLLLCLALIGYTGCGKSNQEDVSYQLVEVERGDLTVSVSGSGNISVSSEATLVFGTSGRINKIYVDDGDNVTRGDLIAKLDTASLELAITQAEIAVGQARYTQGEVEYKLEQAQYNLGEAEYSLNQAKYNLVQAEYDLVQAEYNLAQAEYNLAQAEYDLDQVEIRHSLDLISTAVLEMAEERVRMAEESVELAEESMSLAEESMGLTEERVRMAEEGVRIAEKGVRMVEESAKIAEIQLEAAEQALKEAQKQPDRATITAPFSGIVVSVNVDEGDTVSTATPIVHLIDLGSMELKEGVDEIDIPSVKLNQKAIIEVDALPDLLIEGKVSSISPVPTVQAGLVIYDVTISFDVPEDSEVKVGMSATADIIVTERNDILLLPARAIQQDSSGNTVVKVMVNEQVQEKPVTIGISDGLETEIVSGLDEGETVLIEIRASTEPSRPGGFMFGG